MKKFKDRYVLAEGYPCTGEGHKVFAMAAENVKMVYSMDEMVTFPYIKEFDNSNTPKYRLVLERIEGEK
jgi:hypothetical protein